MSVSDRRLYRWPFFGVLAATAYVVLPWESAAALLSAAVGLLAVVVTVHAVRHHRSTRAAAWFTFAGGLSFWVAGDTVYALNQLVLHEPYPSASDFLYLSAYPLLGVGLFLLARDRGPRDQLRLIDTAVIAAGLGLIYWLFVIAPIAEDTSLPPLTRLVTVAYPTTGMLLLAVVLPLAVRTGRRTASVWQLTLGSAATVVGNVVYTLVPDLSALQVRLVYGLFLFSYLCFAGAARHPSGHEHRDAGGPARTSPQRRQLMLYAASTLLVPTALIIEGVRDPAHVHWLVVALGAIVLFLLVIARLSGFMTTVSQQSDQLAVLAMRDELSGLANRRLFERRLRDALATGSPQVVMLDLNDFKQVNDRFGHAVGDQLLTVVGRRLAEGVREEDLVARMGGDEFAVLLPDADPDAVAGIVERLADTLRTPVCVDGLDLLVGASFGSADGTGITDPWEVLRRADVAMYAAKAVGGGRHQGWAAGLDERANLEMRLGADLRTALDTGQFKLVYQPIVTLPEGRIVAVEALIRWVHPERGFVSPADFIPVAERNGLIVEIGEWVLRTACEQAVVWRDSLGEAAPQRMSVNVSARQLIEPDFPAQVRRVLADTGLDPRHLLAEVTETAVFGGGQATRSVQALHDQGIKLALDDFGTGHSSLGLLQTVPVDVLKVDKSFVDRINLAGRESVIASALVRIAEGLGLQAVAEGVETAEQAAELYRLGYRLAQGYHFGKPVPEPDFQAQPVGLAVSSGQ